MGRENGGDVTGVSDTGPRDVTLRDVTPDGNTQRGGLSRMGTTTPSSPCGHSAQAPPPPFPLPPSSSPFCLLAAAAMFLQYYHNEQGERVYTLKVPGGLREGSGRAPGGLRGSPPASRLLAVPAEDVPVRQPDLLGAPRPLLPRRPLLAAPPGPQAPLRRPAHPAGAAAALSRDRHRERHRELPPPCPVTPNRRARR